MFQRGSMARAIMAFSMMAVSASLPAMGSGGLITIDARREGKSSDPETSPGGRATKRRKRARQTGHDRAHDRKKKRNMRHVSRRVRLKHRKAA